MIEASFTKKIGELDLRADIAEKGLIQLTGENGSGKTTFLRCLAGFMMVDSGTVKINGEDLTEKPVQLSQIVYINQNTYFDHMTVEEHLHWPLKFVEEPDREYIESLREIFGINYSGKLSKLSLGQKLRVAMATGFIRKPRVILLDETMSNISQGEELLESMQKMAGRMSVDIIYVTQDSAERYVADHKYTLHSGAMKKLF